MSAPDKIRIPAELQTRYQVIEVLGAGAMGAVLLGEDRKHRRPVAIKLLRPGRGDHGRARFTREARCLARIRHPNVVEVYEFGEAEGAPFLVMEAIQGHSLEKGVGPHDPVDLMLQVAEGLQAVHDAALVHRDVKPANILVTEDGRAVLADFGLVHADDITALTQEGAMVGTPATMAPEVLCGRPATPASDWYSWGATLYNLVEGRWPYSREAIYGKLMRGRPGPRPELSTRVARDGLGEVLLAALDHDPDRRPGSPGEIRALLSRGAVPTLPRPRTSPSAFRRARRAEAARPGGGRSTGARAALTVLALAGAFGLGLRGAGGDPAPGPRDRVRQGIVAQLDRLLAVVDDDPEVQAALRISDEMGVDEAVRIWRLGRESFRRRTATLPALVQGIVEFEPRPASYAQLVRLALVETLLAESARPHEAPLYRPGEDPQLARALARGLWVRSDPELNPPRPLTLQQRRAATRARLAAKGGRWETLRDRADLWEDEDNPGTFLTILDPQGRPFVDPIRRNDGISIFGESFRGSSWGRGPEVVRVDLLPFHQDLELTLGYGGWHPWVALDMLVVGEPGAAPARFVVRVPAPQPGEGGIEQVARGGLRLRFRRALLPEGAVAIEVRARGLQPVGDPSHVVYLEEIHQRVG